MSSKVNNKTPRLSIVIGALREEKRLSKSLDLLAAYLKEEKLQNSTQVIIVAAQGGDKTQQIALSYKPHFKNLQVIDPGKPVGKGRDIREGMLTANGQIRLFMDADLATPLHHIRTILTTFDRDKPDIVIGVRDLKSMHEKFSRRLISNVGNLCFRIVAGFYVSDTQCGFKAFSAEATEICFSRMTRLNWSFDMELLAIARHKGLQVEGVAIDDWQHVEDGTFANSLGNSWQFLKDLIRIFTYRKGQRYD